MTDLETEPFTLEDFAAVQPSDDKIDGLRGQRPSRRSWLVAAIIVSLGVLAAIFAAVWASDRQDGARDDAFAMAVEHQADQVTAVLRGYPDVLSGVRGLFGSLGQVSRQDFAQYVRSGEILSVNPGTASVGWAPATDPGSVGELEGFVRGDGVADFEVVPDSAAGGMAVPIVYLEPPDQGGLGFNLAADEENAASIDQTRDSGVAVLSPPYSSSAADESGGRAVNLYLSLYANGRTPDSAEGRVASFEGVAFSVLAVDEVFDAARSEIPVTEVEVYDLGTEARPAGPPTAATLLYDSDGVADADGSSGGDVVETEVAGRRWLILVTPGPAFDPPAGAAAPLTVFSVAMVIAGLLAVLVVVLDRARQTIAMESASLADEVSDFVADRESELKIANQEAVRSNRELERYASIAAHDLQEPLRSLLAYASVFERRYGDELNEEALGYLHRMRRAADRARTLVVDLLDYAKLDSAEQRSEQVDLSAAVRIAIDDLALVINENGATIRVGELPIVPGNRRELIGVFSNLLSNAIKYRSEDVPEIVIVAHRRGEFWSVGVRDNGIGIAAPFHDRIFELFRRLEKRDSDHGTGLGLAICTRTVQAHGGRLWVESEEGKGSTFWFTLPVEAPESTNTAP